MVEIIIISILSVICLGLAGLCWKWFHGCQEAKIKLATAESQRQALEQNLQTQSQYQQQLKEEIGNSFAGLASKALEGNNQNFMNLAKSILDKEVQSNQFNMDKKHKELESIITPLNKAVDDYSRQSQEMARSRERSISMIESELKRLVESNSNLASETSALKDALKKPHVRGRWGEVQLKNCIDLAGMSEYCDVDLQSTVKDDDKTLRPDMTVRMPGNRVVVVDAKTPLDAFISALEAKSEEERQTEILRHGRHLKDHVKKLASKSYQQAVGNSADFTVMFLPNESFLYAALEAQSDLVEYAIEKKILIASPPTLIGLLKVIRYGWNEETLAENAQKISDAGIELHKRLCDFVEAFVSVGRYLERARKEYDTGFSRLNSRVLVQARRLEDLGAKSNKNLPDGGAEISVTEGHSPPELDA